MATVSSTTELMDFVAAMGGERKLRVEERLGSGFVRLRVAEAERRQAKHDIRCVEDAVVELLRNSRDAGARHVYVAMGREGDVRTLVVLDDGEGIPEGLQERVFEARVTSKLDTVHMDRWGIHGRGMALYSIRENALEAKVVASHEGGGCSIKTCFDVRELAERADQSSWPALGTDDDGVPSVVRGPHNVIRVCAEFALEEQGSCEVYLGSYAEIVATARRRARSDRTSAELLFIEDLSELPVLERLYVAADAAELRDAAASVGIELSERTCHRIVAGQIAPLASVYGKLSRSGGQDGATEEVDLVRDRRRRRLSKEDAAEFARIMERGFAFVADRYYLSLTAAPRVRLSGDRLVVTFPLEESD